ncbi:HPr family phosphocarrier protein [Paenibacillus sp. NPDC058071]|uniref:HPr family phosphocarrier protein n=1 Tax=Paenibacillus sp. NPDC058071 TaxID=3346326 RepID=UPI0036DD28C3
MRQDYIIQNPLGIHARPARKIVEAAKAFPCSVTLEKEGRTYNARSLVHVISAGARFGDRVTVAAEGEQAEAAVAAVGHILTSMYDLAGG